MLKSNDVKSPWVDGGQKIAELRKLLEITQAELAEQANLPSMIWVADVEAGRRPVPSVFYQTLATEFGMAVADFATLCLKYYDPKAFEALFGSETPSLKLAA